MSETTSSSIGLIGLAVMGQNLALNIADHGFKISVFNRTFEKTSKFLETNSQVTNLEGFKDVSDFVASLSRPRKIIIMVQAGRATDAVIDSLLPLIDEGDIIIDGGNAKWTDSIDREKRLNDKGLSFRWVRGQWRRRRCTLWTVPHAGLYNGSLGRN